MLMHVFFPCAFLVVKPNPPESVSAKEVEGFPTRLRVTWDYPSSWPLENAFPLLFQIRYRPYGSKVWSQVSKTKAPFFFFIMKHKENPTSNWEKCILKYKFHFKHCHSKPTLLSTTQTMDTVFACFFYLFIFFSSLYVHIPCHVSPCLWTDFHRGGRSCDIWCPGGSLPPGAGSSPGWGELWEPVERVDPAASRQTLGRWARK